MAKKVEVDSVRDSYIQYFKSCYTRDPIQRGRVKIEYASLECLEDNLRERERRLRNAKSNNWKYASWKDVDVFAAEIEYLKERIDNFYGSFKYVNI